MLKVRFKVPVVLVQSSRDSSIGSRDILFVPDGKALAELFK
jgi:hypothetical protein